MNHPPSIWQPTQTVPPLHKGEVHLWRIETATPNLLAICQSSLTHEESTHAARRRHKQSREQFIIGRGSLRLLLSAACEKKPALIPLAVGPYGKPELPGTELSFNVAHSGETVLIALRRQRAVGVDIECLDPTRPFMQIAQSSFTPAEVRALAAIKDPQQRCQAFYQCWTRKEAVIKADGRGLSLPLSSFEVPLSPSQTALVQVGSASGSAGRTFYVTDLHVGNNILGAIALESCNDTMKLLMFPPILF